MGCKDYSKMVKNCLSALNFSNIYYFSKCWNNPFNIVGPPFWIYFLFISARVHYPKLINPWTKIWHVTFISLIWEPWWKVRQLWNLPIMWPWFCIDRYKRLFFYYDYNNFNFLIFFNSLKFQGFNGCYKPVGMQCSTNGGKVYYISIFSSWITIEST